MTDDHDAGDAPAAETLEGLMIRLAEARGAGKTICPTEAAKAWALAKGREDWQSGLKSVRATAVRLAKAGALTVYRKGKPADPDDFRGVYRIGLPPVEA